jgi:hypothetical protein
MGATVNSSRQVVMAPWIAQRLRLAALAVANTFGRKQEHVYRLEG